MTKDIRVAAVRVDEILFHPHNIRRDLGDLRQLAASIRRFGVMQPIVVEHHGANLRLRAGHRRLAAARIAGLQRIPAVIHPEALELDEWIMASVQENVMRRAIDEAERDRAIRALLDLGCTYDGIGEAFGVSARTVRSWIEGSTPKRVKESTPSAARRTPGPQPRVPVTALASFVKAWQEEASHRQVTVDEVLRAIQRVAVTGRTTEAVPTPTKPVTSVESGRPPTEIDDAVVERLVDGHRIYGATPAERGQAVSRLLARGLSHNDIEQMTGMNTSRVQRQVAELERQESAA